MLGQPYGRQDSQNVGREDVREKLVSNLSVRMISQGVDPLIAVLTV